MQKWAHPVDKESGHSQFSLSGYYQLLLLNGYLYIATTTQQLNIAPALHSFKDSQVAYTKTRQKQANTTTHLNSIILYLCNIFMLAQLQVCNRRGQSNTHFLLEARAHPVTGSASIHYITLYNFTLWEMLWCLHSLVNCIYHSTATSVT